jgi:hypothetical protein
MIYLQEKGVRFRLIKTEREAEDLEYLYFSTNFEPLISYIL